MSKYTIKQIFIDDWDRFILETPHLNIISVVFKQAEQVINCGNSDLAYALYYCEHCDKFMFALFDCKLRFCNSCVVKYATDRAFNMSSDI